MNILYLTNHLNVGGITSYLLTLATGMEERGHNVYVASGPGALADSFPGRGIEYIRVPANTKAEISPNLIFCTLKLLPVLKEKDIDVIHSNTRVTQVLGCLLGRLSKRHFVSTCHGFFKKRLTRRLFPCWGEKVIAISQQVKEHLVLDFGVKEGDIRVIHNGIDTEKFKRREAALKPGIKNSLGLRDGPVIGIIARLSDVKGHAYLIEAMKTVLVEFPSAQLFIVGEGKMKGGLLSLCNRLGIAKSVFFRDNVPDTNEALCAMDIFVLPSLAEGLGLSLMEAMATGIAPIGSDIGGIRTLIRDGSNGFLVEPGNPQALALKIIELLRDPGRRKTFADNAADFIDANFSKDKTILETERLYLECLNAK